MFLSDEAPTLEMLDFTIRIGSTPTFSYFDFYLDSWHVEHYPILSQTLQFAAVSKSSLNKMYFDINIYLLTATLNFANHF